MWLELLVPLFLAGLAGVAIPVLVHLTRRQRRNVVRFPSLMFLSRIPFREQRSRRIRHWLLFLLRALALAAVVLAFTRPFMDDAEAGAAGGGGPREVVVLLDRSYSMGAEGAFEEAVAEARSILGGLGPLDRGSLVLFDRGAELAVRSTTDPSEIERALDQAAAGSGATRYGPALRVAATVVEESDLPAGDIYLVSDFQRAGLGDDEPELPPGARLTPVPVGALGEGDGGGTWDLAVADLALASSSEAGRERVTVTARVARFGDGGGESAELTLSIDGDEVERAAVSLGPEGAGAVSFRPFTLSLAHTRGEVALVSGGALAANDSRRFVASPGSRIAVRIVESPGARAEASRFLESALTVAADARFAISGRRGTRLSADELAETDVVALNDARPDAASLARLAAFVEEGGGVIVALGPSSSWANAAWDPLPAEIGALRDWESGRAGRLGRLAYDHPVLEPFAGPNSGDFTGARFFRARELLPADSAIVLMRFDDGSPALAEKGFGRGRALLWASTLDSYWSDLPVQPVYLPFVHRLVERASGRSDAVVEFAVGQVLDLDDPGALEAAGAADPEGVAEAADLIAIAPGGGVVSIPGPGGSRFLALEEAGFHTVRPEGADPARPFAVAVNVDVGESELARIDPEELRARIAGSTMGSDTAAAPPAPTGAELELRRADRERRQSLWRWLLLGALALLVAETLLSNRTPALARER